MVQNFFFFISKYIEWHSWNKKKKIVGTKTEMLSYIFIFIFLIIVPWFYIIESGSDKVIFEALVLLPFNERYAIFLWKILPSQFIDGEFADLSKAPFQGFGVEFLNNKARSSKRRRNSISVARNMITERFWWYRQNE